MAVDTSNNVYATMHFSRIKMKIVFLAVGILLATLSNAATLPSELVKTRVDSSNQQQNIKDTKSSVSSSVEMYKNMVLFEQEQLEMNGGIDDDDDDDEKNYNNEGSLLSRMPEGSKVNSIESHGQTVSPLKCISCSGVLPAWPNNQDEQSFCLPDGGGSTPEQDNYNDIYNKSLHQSICTGAVRCWKAIVRELDGLVRISRGCVSGGGNGKHSAQSEQLQLHPCMGAVPVSGGNKTTEGSDNPQHPPYTVWTSSYSFSSTASNQQQQTVNQPPSYAIECCAGHDHCNEGPFPSLPGDGLMTGNGLSLLSAVTWWQWLSIILVTLLLVVAISVYLKNHRIRGRKKRRHHRSKSGRHRKSKKQKHNGFCEDSDDSDKKPRRNLSLTSDSSSSSSLSSIGSSSSCCEGKTNRKRSKRKPYGTTLNMLDLLKDVVVTNDATNEGDSCRQSYAVGYSPTTMTESTLDDDFLPPPYQPKEQNDWTSGSGYGMPVLVQRTLAKQIQLRQLVGKGRYGEVWRATYWNGGHEHVAVKIFLSKDEPSWKRETEIYSTVLMRHDNILGFIGSDIMTSRNSYTTQLLLITHYHQHGSLYDFLQTPDFMGYNMSIGDITTGNKQPNDRPPLTMAQMLNILYTVVAGLCHLHTEIHGTQGKPGIAHRDMKSKNVLIKCARTGTCCVADFGMAVTSRDATLPAQTTATAGAGNNQNTRVGTKRYMAPEVLDDSISCAAALALASSSTPATIPSSSAMAATSSSAYWCFDAYRRGDVYSYALVMWEVLSRTLIPSCALDDTSPQQPLNNEQLQQQPVFDNKFNPYMYRAPYQDRGVSWDPSFDDMRLIVCSTDPILSRPGVATEWTVDPIVNTVVATMRECWHANPNARLPALRVKKTLSKLMKQNATDHSPQDKSLTTEQL